MLTKIIFETVKIIAVVAFSPAILVNSLHPKDTVLWFNFEGVGKNSHQGDGRMGIACVVNFVHRLIKPPKLAKYRVQTV
jgi:hypothetical protein